MTIGRLLSALRRRRTYSAGLKIMTIHFIFKNSRGDSPWAIALISANANGDVAWAVVFVNAWNVSHQGASGRDEVDRHRETQGACVYALYKGPLKS